MKTQQQINMYQQVATSTDPKDLSKRAISSIEFYLTNLTDETLDQALRAESGLNAITLLTEISVNLRDDLPSETLVTLIKIFGQIIKNTHKYMRKEVTTLDNEFAGLRLIFKLLS